MCLFYGVRFRSLQEYFYTVFLKYLFYISVRGEFSLLCYNLSSINTHQIVLISCRYNIVFVGFVS